MRFENGQVSNSGNYMNSKPPSNSHPTHDSKHGVASATQAVRVTTVGVAPGGDGRLRVAFERAPIGMAIFDDEGRLKQVNRALSQALDCESQELLGQSFTSPTHCVGSLIDKDLVDRLFAGELPSYRA